MARPVSIDEKSILEAARTVFLKHGYGASTRSIAKKAGVSEGSLFKHFKTKADLFVAAMEDEGGIAAWEENLKRLVGKGSIRRNLELIGLQVVEHLREILPRIIMVRSSGITIAKHHPGCCSGVPHPIQRLYALANYFRAEAKHGRLVISNPEVQAQIFLGTLVHYAIQQTLFGLRIVDPGVYVRTVVDMFVKAGLPARRERKARAK